MSESPVPTRKVVSKMMTFPEALKEVVVGKKVTKFEWDSPDEYIFLHEGYLSIHHKDTPKDAIHRLMVSEGDLIGMDFMIVEEKNVEAN